MSDAFWKTTGIILGATVTVGVAGVVIVGGTLLLVAMF